MNTKLDSWYNFDILILQQLIPVLGLIPRQCPSVLALQMVGDEEGITLHHGLALQAHVVLNLCLEVHALFHLKFDSMDLADMLVDLEVVSLFFTPYTLV